LKKQTPKYWKTKIDLVFHEYIRRRDCDNETGYCNCITCGTKIHFTQSDAGHFISRSQLATRYSEQNVFAQCRKCNRFEFGRQFEYSLAIGAELSQELLHRSREVVKYSNDEWEAIYNNYKEKLRAIKEKQNF
jgi:hypothetical protein